MTHNLTKIVPIPQTPWQPPSNEGESIDALEFLETLTTSTELLEQAVFEGRRPENTIFTPQSTLTPILSRWKELVSDPHRFEDLQQIQWNILDYVSLAKRMIETEGSQWNRQSVELRSILGQFTNQQVDPAPTSFGSRLFSLFFNPSDPKEKQDWFIRDFQSQLSSLTIEPKDDPVAKAILQKEIRSQNSIKEFTSKQKQTVRFLFEASQLIQSATQAVAKPTLESVYETAIDRALNTENPQLEKESAFLGTALSDKQEALSKMSNAQLEKFTARYPDTLDRLESARQTPVAKDAIPSVLEGHKAHRALSHLLPFKNWVRAFFTQENPKTQAFDSVLSARELNTAQQPLEPCVPLVKPNPALPEVQMAKEQLFSYAQALVQAPVSSPAASALNIQGEQCYTLEQRERKLRSILSQAKPLLIKEDPALERNGNKHKNLILMNEAVQGLGLSHPIVPVPKGISTDQIHAFLTKRAPEIFTHWQQLKNLKETHQDSSPFLTNKEVVEHLEAIRSLIEKVFSQAKTDPLAYSDLNLRDLDDWLKKQAEAGHYLMVRSTGAEDSHQTANAGGNASERYVSPNLGSFYEAIGTVVKSYFSIDSLQNRINAGLNPFEEEPKLAVTSQELIGEPVGGESEPGKIPVSFVAFSNEPLYVGTERFRAMRLSACLGHGEGAVSNQGIGTDTILILQSETDPTRLYYLYDNQRKMERLGPIETKGQVELTKFKNPSELVEKPALNHKALRDIYFSAVLMESLFDHPTDIEGIVKEGKIYFVQARPVNRKPMLPTYLDLKAESILEQSRAEVLVAGKGSVLKIEKKEEILIAPTLEDAQKRFHTGNSPYKLIIVTNPEPSNSHPVVNFSGLGVPCLYSSNEEEISKMLSKLQEPYSIAVCMQTGTLNLWDGSKDKLESHISEGFAVHPAKIALSLPSQTSIKQRQAHLPELKEWIGQLQNARTTKEALEALNKISKHPSLQELRRFLSRPCNVKTPIIEERLKILQSLDRKISQALKEVREVLKQSDSEKRLKSLLHIKILDTLLSGKTTGIGQYSLLDAKEISDSIEKLIDYQKELSHPAHLIEYVLDAPDAALAPWRQFLLSLEPLVENNTIELAQVKKFSQMLSLLKETNVLSNWIIFFLQESAHLPPKERLLTISGQMTPSNAKFLRGLCQKQQLIKQIEHRLESFSNPETVQTAWQECENVIKQLSSPEWIGQVKKASVLVKMTAYQTMSEAIELFDSAIKTMKASQLFEDDQKKVALFKQMLVPYFELSRKWVEELLPTPELFTHQQWPLDRYFNEIQNQLSILSRENSSEQLLPSRDFSVSAAMIGSRTAFARHLPQRLEDVFTLCHQNALVGITALNQKLLDQEQLSQALLPASIKEAIHIMKAKGLGDLTLQRIGMEVTDGEISIQYNVPLRNHSGRIELVYDLLSNQLVFKGKLMGQARDRWPVTKRWVEALTASGVFTLEQPIFQGEQELSFSIFTNPQELPHLLKEYAMMARYSMGRMEPEEIFNRLADRWANQESKFYALTNHLLENPELGATKFYLNYLKSPIDILNPKSTQHVLIALQHVPNNQEIKKVLLNWLLERNLKNESLDDILGKSSLKDEEKKKIHLLAAQPKSLSEKMRMALSIVSATENDSEIDRIADYIIENDLEINEVTDSAEIVFLSNNKTKKITFLSLIEDLSRKGRDVKQAEKMAVIAFQNNDQAIATHGLTLFNTLLKNKRGLDEALKAAQNEFQSTTPNKIINSFKLFQALVENGHGINEAIKTALTVIEREGGLLVHLVLLDPVLELFKTLIENGYGIKEVFETTQSANFIKTPYSLKLFRILVEAGHRIKEALEAAQDGSKDLNSETMFDSFKLFEALVKKGHGIKEALDTAQAGSQSSDDIILSSTLELYHTLVKNGHGIKEATKAAEIGSKHSDRFTRQKASDLSETLRNIKEKQIRT